MQQSRAFTRIPSGLVRRQEHSQWFRSLGFPLGVVALDVMALVQPLVDLVIAVLRRPFPSYSRERTATEALRTTSAIASVSIRILTMRRPVPQDGGGFFPLPARNASPILTSYLLSTPGCVR